MILLDTNVVSELIRPEPDPGAAAWLSAQPAETVFLSVISEAELRYGAAILPPGRRRDRLASEIEHMLRDDFEGRILPFDRLSTRAYAEIASARRAAGLPISYADCQIAAIARSYGACVATRNVDDFQNCGIKVINPWSTRTRL